MCSVFFWFFEMPILLEALISSLLPQHFSYSMSIYLVVSNDSEKFLFPSLHLLPSSQLYLCMTWNHLSLTFYLFEIKMCCNNWCFEHFRQLSKYTPIQYKCIWSFSSLYFFKLGGCVISSHSTYFVLLSGFMIFHLHIQYSFKNSYTQRMHRNTQSEKTPVSLIIKLSMTDGRADGLNSLSWAL